VGRVFDLLIEFRFPTIDFWHFFMLFYDDISGGWNAGNEVLHGTDFNITLELGQARHDDDSGGKGDGPKEETDRLAA
jgi:hypothetical protein